LAIAQSTEAKEDSVLQENIEVSNSEEIAGLDTSFIMEEDSFHVEWSHDHHDHHHHDLPPIDWFDSSYVDPLADFKNPELDSLFLTSHGLYDMDYWLSIDTCFKRCDSMVVNPYGIDGLSITDSFYLPLYDDSLQNWSMPLEGTEYVTSKFGPRGYRYHYGTDLRVSVGDTVRAVFDGVVRICKYNRGGYGYYVLIRHHNGLETLYGHLTGREMKVGQHVKAGEFIGHGGNTGRSTGPHLHFEVRYKGVPIDPQTIFDFDVNSLKNNFLFVSPDLFYYIKIQRQKVYHTVRSGDTIYGLAQKYHVRASQICRLSGISLNTTLRIGRRLRIK